MKGGNHTQIYGRYTTALNQLVYFVLIILLLCLLDLVCSWPAWYSLPSSWPLPGVHHAAHYNTWLLVKLTPKGVVFSFLFLHHAKTDIRVEHNMCHCGVMTSQPKAEVCWAACNTCTAAQPFLITRCKQSLSYSVHSSKPDGLGMLASHSLTQRSSLSSELHTHTTQSGMITQLGPAHKERKIKTKAVRQFSVDATPHRVAHSWYRSCTVLQNNAGTSTGPGSENVLSGKPMWNDGWQARSPLSCL